jgi:hypothetical protein
VGAPLRWCSRTVAGQVRAEKYPQRASTASKWSKSGRALWPTAEDPAQVGILELHGRERARKQGGIEGVTGPSGHLLDLQPRVPRMSSHWRTRRRRSWRLNRRRVTRGENARSGAKRGPANPTSTANRSSAEPSSGDHAVSASAMCRSVLVGARRTLASIAQMVPICRPAAVARPRGRRPVSCRRRRTQGPRASRVGDRWDDKGRADARRAPSRVGDPCTRCTVARNGRHVPGGAIGVSQRCRTEGSRARPGLPAQDDVAWGVQ